eukprot:gene11755-5498_t
MRLRSFGRTAMGDGIGSPAQDMRPKHLCDARPHLGEGSRGLRANGLWSFRTEATRASRRSQAPRARRASAAAGARFKMVFVDPARAGGGGGEPFLDVAPARGDEWEWRGAELVLHLRRIPGDSLGVEPLGCLDLRVTHVAGDGAVARRLVDDIVGRGLRVARVGGRRLDARSPCAMDDLSGS